MFLNKIVTWREDSYSSIPVYNENNAEMRTLHNMRGLVYLCVYSISAQVESLSSNYCSTRRDTFDE